MNTGIRFKTALSAICLAVALLSADSAKALLITAGTTVPVLFGDDNGQAEINAIILPYMGSSGSLLYKQVAVDADDSEPFASSYSTSFGDPLLLDEDFTITYGSGPSINANPVYLLVKDGNASPNWYLYDISGWNGTDVIQGENFFPSNGGISHVSIYGDDEPGDSITPDGGSTIALLGFALIGVDFLRRKISRA